MLPRGEAPLLEAEQQGGVTSALLSGLMGTGTASQWAWEPSAASPRFATEAYRSVLNAAQAPENQAARPANRWEWFA